MYLKEVRKKQAYRSLRLISEPLCLIYRRRGGSWVVLYNGLKFMALPLGTHELTFDLLRSKGSRQREQEEGSTVGPRVGEHGGQLWEVGVCFVGREMAQSFVTVSNQVRSRVIGCGGPRDLCAQGRCDTPCWANQ